MVLSPLIKNLIGTLYQHLYARSYFDREVQATLLIFCRHILFRYFSNFDMPDFENIPEFLCTKQDPTIWSNFLHRCFVNHVSFFQTILWYDFWPWLLSMPRKSTSHLVWYNANNVQGIPVIHTFRIRNPRKFVIL